jgi:hypothetical protein
MQNIGITIIIVTIASIGATIIGTLTAAPVLGVVGI